MRSNHDGREQLSSRRLFAPLSSLSVASRSHLFVVVSAAAAVASFIRGAGDQGRRAVAAAAEEQRGRRGGGAERRRGTDAEGCRSSRSMSPPRRRGSYGPHAGSAAGDDDADARVSREGALHHGRAAAAGLEGEKVEKAEEEGGERQQEQ